MICIKLFVFIKEVLFMGLSFLSSLVSTAPLSCRTNETRHIKWHETCKCECRLDASVCNNKQRWNDDKCRCECKGKESLIKDLFGVLVIVSVNVIRRVMLVNI